MGLLKHKDEWWIRYEEYLSAVEKGDLAEVWRRDWKDKCAAIGAELAALREENEPLDQTPADVVYQACGHDSEVTEEMVEAGTLALIEYDQNFDLPRQALLGICKAMRDANRRSETARLEEQ